MKLFYHKSLILRKKLRFGMLLDIFGAILFASLAILFYSFYFSHSAQASWYDENWAYREAIPIATHTASESNVYITFQLDTATLITSGKLQSACQDIRVSDVNGKLLAYHVGRTNACNNAATTIDALVPTMPAGSQTYYVYYGNPAATSNDAGAFSQSICGNSCTTNPTLATEEKGPGPVVYWQFNEGYGTAFNDLTTNAINGSIVGATTWQSDSLCVAGKCLVTAGSGRGNVASNAKINTLTSNVSFNVWVRASQASSSTWPEIMADSNTHIGYGFRHEKTTGKIYLEYGTGICDGSSFGTLTLNNSVTDNIWHMLSMTQDGSTIRVYFDGNQLATTASVAAFCSANGEALYFANALYGAVDEAKVYNYARSAAQIKQDFLTGSASLGSKQGNTAALGANPQAFLSNGLAGYWRMDESSYSFVGSEVVDSSGYGNHGNAGSTNAATFGTSTGGNSTTTLIDTGKTWTTNVFVGDTIRITGGTGSGQTRQIASNTANTITVSSTWTTPDATSTYIIVANTTTAGEFGYGGYFDGSYGYLTLANPTTLQITGALTLSAWINLTNTSSIHDIIAKDGVSGNYGYRLFTDASGKLNLEISSNGTAITTVTGGTTLSNSTWYHVIGTYDPGKSMLVFINGTQDGINTTSIPSAINNPSSVNLEIGSQFTGSTNMFFGTIDEARVYNRAFSPSEALGLASFTTSPSGRWDFEEGTGTTVNDISGNTNTGTWQGTLGSQWSQGKYGKGGNFNGSNNYVSVANTLSGIKTISFWVNPNTTTQSLLDLNGSAYITVSAGTISTTGFTSPIIYINGIITSTLSASTWQYVTVTTATALSGSAITFGRANSAFLTGKMDGVVMYNYTRTPKQIVSDMNASHPNVGSPVGSPVGYWDLNEGYGTTANNSGNAGSALNGTIVNAPTWTQSGKFDKALSFTTASSQYVSIPDNIALKPSTFSLSFWVMKNSEPANLDRVFAKHNAGKTQGWVALFDSSATRKLYTAIYNTAAAEFNTSTLNTILPTSTWRYYAYTFDGAILTAYENGIRLGSITFTGTFTPDTNALIFAANRTNNGNFAPITLDEVKFYNYALTSDEVKLDMNRQSSEVLGALSDNSSYQPQAANQEYCVPGDANSCAAPVGEWKFENGSGSSVSDTSGSNITGTWSGTLGRQWAAGKMGTAGNFNGTNNAVGLSTSPDTVAGDLTMEGWIKFPSVDNVFSGSNSNNWWIIQGVKTLGSSTNYLGIGTSLGTSNHGHSGWVFQAPYNLAGNAAAVTVSKVTTISPNTWYFVTGQISGSTMTLYINGVSQATGTISNRISANASWNIYNLQLCCGSTNLGTPALIDQVRYYNYARTPAQIAWDYNKGGPTGWWDFDECQGTIAHDASGNSLNGTITIGATGTQTAAGTCIDSLSTSAWNNGKTGKINSSLNFDGTDDKVTVGDISSKLNLVSTTPQSFSISMWANLGVGSSSPNNLGGIVLMSGNTVRLYTNPATSPAKYCFQLVPASTQICTDSVITTGGWHHVVGIYNNISNLIAIYLDGIFITSATPASTNLSTQTMSTTIGNAQGYFKGQIDDARVYNYPLTATQIKTLYNNGAINFAPNIGSP